MNPLRLIAALTVATATAAALAATGVPNRFLPGEHYSVLQEPAPVVGEAVEVIEFFLYGCPHCHQFEPAFRDWTADAPEDVRVRRVPATFGGNGPIHARLFYTAQALGRLDDLHAEVFAAVHEQGRPLASRSQIRAFFTEHGVSGDDFDATFDSEAVTAKVRAAGQLMRVYRVTSVPSLGVNGRYWVSARQAGGQAGMLEVTDYLIARER